MGTCRYLGVPFLKKAELWVSVFALCAELWVPFEEICRVMMCKQTGLHNIKGLKVATTILMEHFVKL